MMKIFRKKYNILSRQNPKRHFFKDLFEFEEFLLEKFLILENECRTLAQVMWLQIFDLIKNDARYNSPKEYFIKNNFWPKLEIQLHDKNYHVYSSIFYQLLLFFIENKIIKLEEINEYYPKYSIDFIVKDFKMFLIVLYDKSFKKFDAKTQRQILFGIQDIFQLLFDYKISNAKNVKLFNEFVNFDKTFIQIIIEILFNISNETNLINSLKTNSFISKKRVNIAFIVEQLIISFIKSSAQNQIHVECRKIEDFVINNVNFLRNLELGNNLELLLSSNFSEKTIEIFISLLSKIIDINPNCLDILQGILRKNFSIIINTNSPKLKLLIKEYFTLLFKIDFQFISQLLFQDYYNFDILANLFIDKILSNETHQNGLEEFIVNCCTNEEKIFVLFVTIEKSLKSPLPKVFLILNKILGNLKIFKSNDAICTQMKIISMILIHYNQTNIFVKEDIENVMRLLDNYINEKQVILIKEVISTLGILMKYILSASNNEIQIKEYCNKVLETIQNHFKSIQTRFFPIKTSYLKQNTKEYNDFELVFNSFLHSFNMVRNFEFLELLFPIIREERSNYSNKIKITLKEYINELINNSDKEVIQREIKKIIDIFLNTEIDKNLKDNIRFSIMSIVGYKMLKKCDVEVLKNILLFYYRKLEEIIKQNIQDIKFSSEKKFTIILEKTTVFKILEICFKRIPTEMIKVEIHKKLFGESAIGNEMTKILIVELHNSKKSKIPDYDVIVNNINLTEDKIEVYIKYVENKFYCLSYNCLSAIIKNTQTKEEIFTKFLFQTFREKGEKLWELLVDEKYEYNFLVETNFLLKFINKKKTHTKKENAVKKLLIEDIVSDSFFHDVYGKTLKESIIFEQKTLLVDKPNNISKLILEKFDSIKAIDVDSNNKQIIIEDDKVNKHPCMSSVIEILDFLNTTFVNNSSNLDILPSYIQQILYEMKKEDNNLNIKIFFIKIVINCPHIFDKYFKYFLPILIKYSLEKNNGGKGFHYFLRDIATQVISSNVELDISKENSDLCSNYVNSLIKVSGDQKNLIFKTNLKIINDLIDKFKNLVYINKKVIIDMLKLDDSKPTSHIWKIAMIQVLASSIEYNIPLGEDNFSLKKSGCDKYCNVISSFEKNEELFNLIFKLFDNHKTSVVSATTEYLSKLLFIFDIYRNDISKPYCEKYFNLIYDFFEEIISLKEIKSSANIIFHASLHYKALLTRKKIFKRCLTIMKNLTQNYRILLIQSLNNLFQEFKINKIVEKEDQKMYVDEVFYSIYQMIDVLFVDQNDDFILSILKLIEYIYSLKDPHHFLGLESILTKIQNSISRFDEVTRRTYFSFLMRLYENIDETKIKHQIFNYLIYHLDKEKELNIKDSICEFFNRNENLSLDPVERFLTLLTCLNESNIQENFIQNIDRLLILLSKKSSDFERKIYEKSLDKCQFKELNLDYHGYYLDRSQPLTPSMTVRMTMDETYDKILKDPCLNQLTQQGYLRATQNIFSLSEPSNASNDFVMEGTLPSQEEIESNFLSLNSSLVTFSQNLLNTSNENKKRYDISSLKNDHVFKPPKVRKKKGLSKFLQENEMFYTTVDSYQGNKVRFIPEGSFKDNKKQSNSYSDVIVNKWLNRQTMQRKSQIKLMRKYRIGDIPDIQINNSEIILPLLSLAEFNMEISTEVFLDIVESIYIDSCNINKNFEIHDKIILLMKNVKISHYQIVSCLHRLIIKIMGRTDEFIPEFNVIKNSGILSKNYFSSILILEEFIINNSVPIESENASTKKKKTTIENEIKEINKKRSDILINETNKLAWIHLLKFYSKIKMEDYQIGIVQNFADNYKYFCKNGDFLFNFSNLLNKPLNSLNKSTETSNYLKTSLAENSLEIFLDEDLKEIVDEYSIKISSDLAEWDHLSDKLNKGKISLLTEDNFTRNPEKMEQLLKSWIFNKNYNEQLSKFLDSMGNRINNFKNNHFSYYLSLFYILHKNWDMALLHLEKSKENFFQNWYNRGNFSNNLKHELINNIQKLNEVHDFLDISRRNLSVFDASITSNLFEKWLKVWPNITFDDPSIFHETFEARNLFYDIFNSRFDKFNSLILKTNKTLNNFHSFSQMKIAGFMMKKNHFDIAEINTKNALKLRNDQDFSTAYLTVPFLKTKFKILEIDIENSLSDKSKRIPVIEKCEKFIKVLENQLKSYNFDENSKVNLNLLDIKISLNLSCIHLNEENSNLINQDTSNFYLTFRRAYKLYENQKNSLEAKIKLDGFLSKNYIKLIRPITNFCDKVLRTILKGDIFDKLSIIMVENGLNALIFGDTKSLSIIPKLLHLISKNSILGQYFQENSIKVAPNYFLKWKSQLIAYINSNISIFITPIIHKLLKYYPQSLYFPFSVIDKYSELLLDFQEKSNLFYEIKRYYSEFLSLNSFLESLDGLTNPEHRLKFWIDNIKEVLLGEENVENKMRKLEVALNLMYYDILVLNKKFTNNRIGTYNQKFAKDYEKIIKSNLNIENLAKIAGNNLNVQKIQIEFNILIEPLLRNINKSLSTQLSEGIEKLSSFSEFLSQYECNEFYDPKHFIELPITSDSESVKTVKISSFDQSLLVLNSIRKPKRISIYGSDEKTYMYLVKGGEDLRLDDRIMKIFRVFNDILSKDFTCKNKNLKLNTFNVFPMTLRLGMLEWINNTQPLKSIIKFSMNKLFKNTDWDIKNSSAQMAKLKWLKNFDESKSVVEQHYLALHSKHNSDVISNFILTENMIPKTVLKRAIENSLTSPEEILNIRINFIRNYSVICAAGYVLGIGDRHLENFLVNVYDSQVYLIDFGISFGQGLHQLIPELVPFRLTHQIRSVIWPLGVRGCISQTIVNSMTAFKHFREEIIDCCEIFVKEPLIDWIKVKKLNSYNNTDINNVHNISRNWVPMKKLNMIQNKLLGINPIFQLLEECLETRHKNEKTFDILKNILYGDENSLRYQFKESNFLSVQDQVDVLIEQATDPNLLGRMWIGWSPYI